MDKTKQILNTIIKDPVHFVKFILQATPQPWQIDFLNAVVENDRVAVRSGHGVGKTTCLSWLILWFLVTRYPVKIGITAPTSQQLTGALWSELRKWHSKMILFQDALEITNDQVRLTSSPGENFAIARTSSPDKPEALSGLHSENMVFIIDEASGVEEAVFEASSGSMSTKGAKIILTGNPTRAEGYFYNAFNKTPELWKLFKVSCQDCLETGFTTQKYIDEQQTIYGENSNAYRARVLGEFPDSSEDVLLSRSVVESAIDRDVDVIPTAPVIWGLDVGRNRDRSALCKRKGNHILDKVKTWNLSDSMAVAARIADEYEKTPFIEKPIQVYVDSIGIGGPVVDRLKQLGVPAVGVNVGTSPSEDRFMRLRDELWWRAKEWFDAQDVRIPKDDLLIAELVTPRVFFTKTQKLQMESKDEMRKRGHRSPDLADAFCLTMMNTGTSWINAMKEIQMNRSWIV